MPTLFFPERHALQLVLASGGIAASVSGAPASAGFDEQNRLWLSTSAWLPRETLLVLSRYGVQVLGAGDTAPDESVSCWHELLPLTPATPNDGSAAGTVLFDVPGTAFTALAGEIERLGAASYSYSWRQSLDDAVEDDRVLLKIVAPPVFTMLRVLEGAGRHGGIRAFTEQAPGVWVAVGYRHACEHIPLPKGKMLLIRPPRRWEWLNAREFATPVGRLESASAVPSEIRDDAINRLVASLPAVTRTAICPTLRLHPGADDSPAEMWIVYDNSLDWLKQFVRTADESSISRFSFALAKSDRGLCLALRVRRGKEPPPVLVGLAPGYCPLLKLANLWAPCGLHLQPMPRRDTLRQMLAGDSKQLSWLSLAPEGGFQAESLPLAAFHPLKDWVDYCVTEAIEVHDPWVKSSGWELERFTTDVAEATGSHRSDKSKAVATGRKPAAEPKLSERESAKSGLFARTMEYLLGPAKAAKKKTTSPPPEIYDPGVVPEEIKETASRLPRERSFVPLERELQARELTKKLKSKFLANLTKLTDDDRFDSWPELAEAFAKSGSPAEAAICWLNAIWAHEEPSPDMAWNWLAAEAAQTGWSPRDARIADWLSAEPKPSRVRLIAAYAYWASLQKPLSSSMDKNAKAIQAYLESHEDWLTLRAVWLSRTALARLNAGDVKALAETRDRLLGRLMRNGFTLEETPAFIRWGESDDPDRFELVSKRLIDRRDSIQRWIKSLGPDKIGGSKDSLALDQFGIEAEVHATQAYADLMLSWALARLGEKAESSRLRDQAWQNLHDADPIHAWLKSAFDYRIRQAREGKTAGGPFPQEFLDQLEALPTNDRYRIDRLRSHLKILDSSEHLDVYWASTYRHFEQFGRWRQKLNELPGLAPAALNERVKTLLTTAKASALPDVTSFILDYGPNLEKSLAETVLEQIPATLDLIAEKPQRYLKLLEKGILFAASLDRPSAVQLLVQRFVGFVEKHRGLQASTILEGLTNQTFRCQRRFGMKREAYDTLGKIHMYLTGGQTMAKLKKGRAKEWPYLMRSLLHIAAAYNYCGQEELGDRIIDPIRHELFTGQMLETERTALALTYASILGQFKVSVALGRVEELFLRLKKITIRGWNTHYTRQPLELLDTVLLAIVSEDFALGPSVRGWLDDDEYLVRQRIHKDLKLLMEQEGV